jgi:hypothetical protein
VAKAQLEVRLGDDVRTEQPRNVLVQVAPDRTRGWFA